MQNSLLLISKDLSTFYYLILYVFYIILKNILILYSNSEDIEDITNDLLFKLMETSIKASLDNNKVIYFSFFYIVSFIYFFTHLYIFAF